MNEIHKKRVPFFVHLFRLILFFHVAVVAIAVSRIKSMRVHNLFEYTKRNRPPIQFCIINFRLKSDELNTKQKKIDRIDIEVVFIIFVFF